MLCIEFSYTVPLHLHCCTILLVVAALLVETGMVLRTKKGMKGGITTPAAALGSDLTKQILENMDATFEIKEMENDSQ
jgi:short subunit dehydrogenase-like uncharacterized protein